MFTRSRATRPAAGTGAPSPDHAADDSSSESIGTSARSYHREVSADLARGLADEIAGLCARLTDEHDPEARKVLRTHIRELRDELLKDAGSPAAGPVPPAKPDPAPRDLEPARKVISAMRTGQARIADDHMALAHLHALNVQAGRFKVHTEALVEYAYIWASDELIGTAATAAAEPEVAWSDYMSAAVMRATPYGRAMFNAFQESSQGPSTVGEYHQRIAAMATGLNLLKKAFHVPPEMAAAKFVEGLAPPIKKLVDLAMTLSPDKDYTMQLLATMATSFERNAPAPKPKDKEQVLKPGRPASGAPTAAPPAATSRPRGIALAATAAPAAIAGPGLDAASLEVRIRARSLICEGCGGEHYTRLCETSRGSRPRLSDADGEALHQRLREIRSRIHGRGGRPATERVTELSALVSSDDHYDSDSDPGTDASADEAADESHADEALPREEVWYTPEESFPATTAPLALAAVARPRTTAAPSTMAPGPSQPVPSRAQPGSLRSSPRGPSASGGGITASMFLVAIAILGLAALGSTIPTPQFGVPQVYTVLADSGAGQTFLNEATLAMNRTPGFTPGRTRSILVSAPLMPPARVVGRDVTVQVTVNGRTATVRAFATAFHGTFTNVDAILNATTSAELGLIRRAPRAAEPGIPPDRPDPAPRGRAPRGVTGDDALHPGRSPAAAGEVHPPGLGRLTALAGIVTVSQAQAPDSSKNLTFHSENQIFLLPAVTAIAAITQHFGPHTELELRAIARPAHDGGAFLRSMGWSWTRRTSPRQPRPSAPVPIAAAAMATTTAPAPPPPPFAPSAPATAPHPGAGATVHLIAVNGTVVGNINAGFTPSSVTDPVRFQAQVATLTAALRANLALPLMRHHYDPLLIPFAADADFEASWTEARIFAVRERQAAAIDKLVTHGTQAGYLERWVPAPGDLLGRPAGAGYCLCPVFVVEKVANGIASARVVCDLRNANKLTNLSTARPTANMDDHINFAMGVGYFNVIDASKSFYAISTSADPARSVIACFRHRGEIFMFKSLTMGGALSPGFYQVASDAFCRSIGPGCRAYIDDLVDTCPQPSQTPSGLWDVSNMMDHCIATALALAGPGGFLHNADKSVFAAGRATVCGIICGQGQSAIPPATLARTIALDAPTCAKDCQRVAGIFNDLAGHVPGLGACAGALSQGAALTGSVINFPEDASLAVAAAFAHGKELLTRAVPLHIVSDTPTAILTLYHDSCRDGMAYMLAEWDWPGPGPIPSTIPEHMVPNDSDPRLRIIRLGSKATAGNEKVASAYQCEMNGARYAYEQCRHLLLGRFVVAVSDHRAWCLTLSGPAPKPKNLRTLILATYGFRSQPVHKSGASGLRLTDSLSRAIRGSSASISDCIQYEAELAAPAAPVPQALIDLGFTVPLPAPPAAGYTRPHPPAPADEVSIALAAFAALDGGETEDIDTPETITIVIDLTEKILRDTTQKKFLVDSAIALAATETRRASARLASRGAPSDAPPAAAPPPPAPGRPRPARAASPESSSSSGLADEDPLPAGPPGPRLTTDADGFVPIPRLARTSSGKPFPSAVAPDPAERWLRGQPRRAPALPLDRSDLIKYFHGEVSHLGHSAVSRAIRDAGNDWRGLDDEVTAHCRHCPACQIWNTAAPGYSMIPTDIYNEARPGMHLAADVMKMTTSREGYTGVLIVMDVASRFVMAAPIKHESTEEITFLFGLVFSINGPFCRLTVDNNPVFAGVHVERLCAQFGAEVTTTSEYSSSNRAEVGGCKFVGDSLRKACSEAGDARLWPALVWGTVAGLNSAYHFTASCKKGFTPFEVYHARPSPLALPRTIPDNPLLLPSDEVALQRLRDLVYANDVLNPLRAQALSEAAVARARAHADSHKIVSFPVGTPVLIHRGARAPKWRPRWKGPYIVARRSTGGAYLLARRDGTFLTRRFPAQQLKRWQGPLKDALGEDLAEFIVADKVNELGQVVYQVHWYGYGADQRTWEPASSFINPGTLLGYHSSSVRPYPLED